MKYHISFFIYKIKPIWGVIDVFSLLFYMIVIILVVFFALYYQLAFCWLIFFIVFAFQNRLAANEQYRFSVKRRA